MSEPLADRPPTIDPVAARRWERIAPKASPWLHEEVGSRMVQRLSWIRRQPDSWVNWDATRGGRKAHASILRQYPKVRLYGSKEAVSDPAGAHAHGQPSWWHPSRWLGRGGPPPAAPARGVDFLWANMILHSSCDPRSLIAAWHRALGVDGFLMFSCLGPDSLLEIRQLYAELGWPPAGHELTDMHDWGDMLVQAGFAEPVMDMERMTLSYKDPARLLLELRELGRNFHPARFPGLRARLWRERLTEHLQRSLARPEADGRMALSFEIIYGHAFKPAPRPRMGPETSVSVDEMRAVLQRSRGSSRQR